ncbi:hypothetical protein [Paraliomyxa miuraensis]|uniref:hypothetical protein n=1 Tax=Paraliomyxa miuraensis TaxID=376150 RepID=UPI002257C479|nr:hypothetical protein [Paraliomyxa miuraensis]MCX4245977.1 hypothetical protein [Paraliomyxa miuraensis]
MPRIFVAQSLVDQWLADGIISLDGDLLRMSAVGTPTSLFINPAVYFEKVDGDEPDPYQVVGCVKSSQELAQMGAEHFDTSVVLGELAYTVMPGFIAVPVGPDGTETLMDGAAWARLQGALALMAG